MSGACPAGAGQKEYSLAPSTFDWGIRQPELTFDPSDPVTAFKSDGLANATNFWNSLYGPWKNLEAKGVGVMAVNTLKAAFGSAYLAVLAFFLTGSAFPCRVPPGPSCLGRKAWGATGFWRIWC